MADPFLSEIRIMSFSYAPRAWAQCNGQFLPINQNQPLFSLLGTTYGGNGQTTFALPDLRSKTPIHAGSGHTLGEQGGQQSHTVTISELPQHTHVSQATNDGGTTNTVAGNVLANVSPNELYVGAQNLVATVAGTISNVGGSQAHQNMQPYLTLNFCIALQGRFPSQN